ncbi:hypothetical protein V3390_00280 [Luteimonas sp. FXH3W]|uniref:Uncharacterized protein n=1 Tax=Aquilutibacter rugosus TaxID=3115820 RepID=A0ABU7UYK2_9GAMM
MSIDLVRLPLRCALRPIVRLFRWVMADTQQEIDARNYHFLMKRLQETERMERDSADPS